MALLLGGLCVGFLALALPWTPGAFRALPWVSGCCLLAAVPLAVSVPRLAALSGALGLGLFSGFAVTADALAGRVPSCADTDYQHLVVVVASRPERRQSLASHAGAAAAGRQRTVSRFEARVLGPAGLPRGSCVVAAGSRLRLSWYDAPPLGKGQRWQVSARVRPPWGYQNAGGFDYERWLLGRGIQGTGYVREGRLLTHAPSAADGLRSWLEEQGADHRGLILALVEGDRSGISPAQWEVLRATGTVHLMVVSGLHVGLLCACGYALVLGVLRLTTVGRLLRPQPIAAAAALAAGAAFVVGTGSGVPALRAWLMAAAFLCTFAGGWRCSGAMVLLVSLTLVLLADPLAVHQQGTYLSFGAVAALLAVLGARSRPGWIPALGLTQLVLFVVLTPVLALQQGQVPGLGVLVNLLAVPLLGVLLPLLLAMAWLHAVVPALAALLLVIAQWALSLMEALLAVAAGQGLLRGAGGSVSGLLLMLPAAYLQLSLTAWRWRAALLLPWAIWLAPPVSGVPPGQVRLSALDVGQGSALVLETQGHRLLFDSGPAYPGGFDLGAQAVAPFLSATGHGALDMLVLSHADSDHTGGAAAVLEAIGSSRISASFALPAELAAQAPENRRCLAGRGWDWDDVSFEFLHPERVGKRDDGNDASCVLRVVAGGRTLLIGGDISARVERGLLRRYGDGLAADAVTAPHHGSATSSSAAFVSATKPRTVMVSAPRRSRYGHPHPQVMQRYRDLGAKIGVTGRDGTLVWESWRPGSVQRRRERAAYWVNRQPSPRARAHRDG